MHTCIILVGLPCTGKSTLTFPGYKKLSSDGFIEEWCKEEGISYSEGFPKFIKSATKAFFDGIKESVKNGEDIVIDRTSLNKKSREKILNLIPSSYYKKVVVMDFWDIDTISDFMERIRPEKVIPYHVLENMVETYETPSLDEGVDEVIFNRTFYNRER